MVTCAREASYSGDNRSEGPCIDIRRMRTKLQLLHSTREFPPLAIPTLTTPKPPGFSGFCVVLPVGMGEMIPDIPF
jgi:hypothetical protein